MSNKDLNILVVDDSKLARRFMELAIEQSYPGIKVAQASTLAEARQKLGETRFDATVIDRLLVNEDGLDLIRAIRSEASLGNQDTKILLASGNELTPAMQAEAMQAGADACAKKDNMALFKPALEKFMEQHLPQAEKRGAAHGGAG